MQATLTSPDRRNRVVHLIQNLNYGGMERVLHNLARQLPGRGFDVHVVVMEYLGHFGGGLDEVATIHRLPPMSRFSMIYPGSLVALLKRLDPGVVHSHSGVWFKASRAARSAGVPVIVHTDHGRPDAVPFTDRVTDNIASRLTDAVIAVSDSLADLLRRQVVRYPARIRVITNGVDVNTVLPPIDRAALRAKLGLPVEACVIGSVGRLEPVKNYELALQAFAQLEATNGVSPILVLVGDGSERARLEQLAITIGIASRVHFLGWRTDADRLHGAFDLFTLTSTSEGTSLSLLEAMSSGICPVTTDVGGNRAVMGPDLESLIVPPDDPLALAAAWRHLLTNPILRAEMGRRARHRVETTFSLEQMVDRHVALYQELFAQSGGHRCSTTSLQQR